MNNFALRCFRDIADGDYISARMAFRAESIPQAPWSSEQAIQKYVKAILLLRRIESKDSSHSLNLEQVEDAVNHPPQQYRSLSKGKLEQVLSERKHPARPSLIWNNLQFGGSLRKTIKIREGTRSANSPLALYPVPPKAGVEELGKSS